MKVLEVLAVQTRSTFSFKIEHLLTRNMNLLLHYCNDFSQKVQLIAVLEADAKFTKERKCI